MYTAAPRRDVAVAAAQSNRSGPVSVPGHDVGCDACEFRSGLAFQLPAGTERHRGGQVDQEPGGEFAFFQVLADEKPVHARGDVPVDAADLVPRLILSHLSQIKTGPVEHAGVIAKE